MKINFKIFIPFALVAVFLFLVVLEYRATAIRIMLPLLMLAVSGYLIYGFYCSLRKEDPTQEGTEKNDDVAS